MSPNLVVWISCFLDTAANRSLPHSAHSSAVTSGADNAVETLTSDGSRYFGTVTSGAAGVASSVTSGAGSVATGATNGVAGAATGTGNAAVGSVDVAQAGKLLFLVGGAAIGAAVVAL